MCESVVKLIWAQKRKVRSSTEIVVVGRFEFGDYCSGQIVKNELNWWYFGEVGSSVGLFANSGYDCL